MCINVDFPDPDGPVTARNSPGFDVERDAGERADLAVADRIGLDQIPDRDDGRHVLLPAVTINAESAGTCGLVTRNRSASIGSSRAAFCAG